MATPKLTAARAAIAAEIECLNAIERTYYVGQRVTVEIQAHRVDVDDQHPNENSMSMAALNGLVRGVGLPSGITPAAAAERRAGRQGDAPQGELAARGVPHHQPRRQAVRAGAARTQGATRH